MHRVSVDVISRFAVFAQITSVAFDRLAFVVAHGFRVGLYKTAIEDTSGQAFVVVCFDGFEVMNGDTGLIADFAQTDAALLASESQLFAYTRCHLQSLVSCVLGWTAAKYGCVQLPLFLHYSSTAKRCQTFVLRRESEPEVSARQRARQIR